MSYRIPSRIDRPQLRSLAKVTAEKRELHSHLSLVLAESMARHEVEQREVALAIKSNRPNVSRMTNPEDRAVITAVHTVLLCQHPDPRLRAVGVDLLSELNRMVGAATIPLEPDGHGPNDMVRLGELEREGGEARMSVIEGAADGHWTLHEHLRAARENEDAARAHMRTANHHRAEVERLNEERKAAVAG